MFKNSIILFFPITKENQRNLDSVPKECIQNADRIEKTTQIMQINKEKIFKCQSLGSLSKKYYGESFCDRAEKDYELAEKMRYDLYRDLTKNCSKKEDKE